MYRGKVTAVDALGVYVLVPSLHPTAAFGPLDHVGARPAVGARVLVADCGDESAPDLVVMTGSGPPGPPGPPGPVAVYVHTQAVASAVWTINHGLGYRPSVTVVDSAGMQMFGAVEYPPADLDTVTVRFEAPFGGQAYCS